MKLRIEEKVVLALIVIVAALAVIGLLAEQRTWRTFAEEHNCVAIEKKEGGSNYRYSRYTTCHGSSKVSDGL